MAEYQQPEQTLKEALIAEGSHEQANLLSGRAASLTRHDLIKIVNYGDWSGLSGDEIIQLREISVKRLRNGQPIFPWNDEKFLEEIYIEKEKLVY